jgi:hypothetical protein
MNNLQVLCSVNFLLLFQSFIQLNDAYRREARIFSYLIKHSDLVLVIVLNYIPCYFSLMHQHYYLFFGSFTIIKERFLFLKEVSMWAKNQYLLSFDSAKEQRYIDSSVQPHLSYTFYCHLELHEVRHFLYYRFLSHL